MLSKLMFIVNDQKIEFHSHEVVKIAQQMVVEAEDKPIDIPDYSSYPDHLEQKIETFMKNVTYQFEECFGFDRYRLIRDNKPVDHILCFMLMYLYKTNMTHFLTSGLFEHYSELLRQIKDKKRPCLIKEEVEEDILLPPSIANVKTIQNWLFITRYFCANPKEIPVIAWWLNIAGRLILLKNLPANRQHFYVSDHGFSKNIIVSIKNSLLKFTNKKIPYFENGLAQFSLVVNFWKNFYKPASQEVRGNFKTHFIRVLIDNPGMDDDKNLFVLLTLSTPRRSHCSFFKQGELKLPLSSEVGYPGEQYNSRVLPLTDEEKVSSQYRTFEKIFDDLIERTRYMTVIAKEFTRLAFELTQNPFFTQLENIFHRDDADKFRNFFILIEIAKHLGEGYQEFLYRPVHSFGAREEGESYRNFANAFELYFTSLSPLSESQLAAKMRDALKGEHLNDERLYFIPNLIAAWFASEAARNETSILSGLILLDLIESNILLIDKEGNNLYSWKHVLIHPKKPPHTMTKVMILDLYGDEVELSEFDGTHPMAHKGSVKDAKNKLGKGHKLSVVHQKEGNLILDWLYHRIKQSRPDINITPIDVETTLLVYEKGVSPNYDGIDKLFASKDKPSKSIKKDPHSLSKWKLLHEVIIPFLRERLSSLKPCLLATFDGNIFLLVGEQKISGASAVYQESAASFSSDNCIMPKM